MRQLAIEMAANFILVLGFGILLQAPKRSLLFLGLTGTTSWAVLTAARNLTGSIVIATFLAALTIGICGEIFARLKKLPATTFIMSGILPLVPGIPAYNMMLHVMENNYLLGLEKAVDTLLIATAISFGIATAVGFAQYFTDQ